MPSRKVTNLFEYCYDWFSLDKFPLYQMNMFVYSCRIASLLFARDCVLPIDALMAPLRGFDKLWSVAAVPQGTRDSRQGDIAVRAVVGQDSRSNGISCMSCNGSICPHRALACAILDVTSADLAAMWRSTRVRCRLCVRCTSLFDVGCVIHGLDPSIHRLAEIRPQPQRHPLPKRRARDCH